MHLRAYGASSLSSEDLHSTTYQRRQHGNGEEDDTQSAYPLHERAPEQDAVGQPLDIVDDGDTGGGEPRHGLEESISHREDAAMEDEGKHAEETEDNPGEGDDDVGITTIQRVLCIASEIEEDKGSTEGEQRRHEECQRIVLGKREGHDKTPRHEEGLDEEQRAQNLRYDVPVDQSYCN